MQEPSAVVLAWTARGHTVTTLTATTANDGSAPKKYSEITGLCHGYELIGHEKKE